MSFAEFGVRGCQIISQESQLWGPGSPRRGARLLDLILLGVVADVQYLEEVHRRHDRGAAEQQRRPHGAEGREQYGNILLFFRAQRSNEWKAPRRAGPFSIYFYEMTPENRKGQNGGIFPPSPQ